MQFLSGRNVMASTVKNAVRSVTVPGSTAEWTLVEGARLCAYGPGAVRFANVTITTGISAPGAGGSFYVDDLSFHQVELGGLELSIPEIEDFMRTGAAAQAAWALTLANGDPLETPGAAGVFPPQIPRSSRWTNREK